MIPYFIKDFDAAKMLVNVCDKCDFDVYVICGDERIDGKSFLGILSLTGKHVTVHPQTANKEEIKDFIKSIKG